MTAFSQIADKLRRAARNQERLHLDYELVMAILTSPVYSEIAKLESEEFATSWQASSSTLASSGSHGGQTGVSVWCDMLEEMRKEALGE